MGMDMYTRVQTLLEDGWHSVDSRDAPLLHRNYSLFALLSGLNRTGKPIKTILQYLYGDEAERDPPVDLTTETYQDYIVITKYYTASGDYVMDDEGGLYWYTLDELLRFNWRQLADETRTWVEEAGIFYSQLIPWMQKLGSPDKVRLLLGFSF